MSLHSLLLLTMVTLLTACAESTEAEDLEGDTAFDDTCDVFFDAVIACAEGAAWDTTSYEQQRTDACADWSAESEAECGDYYQCMADLYNGRDCADDADVQAINDGIAGCGSCGL